MISTKARLHMHNHTEPNGRAFIVGEKAALRSLGEALIKASKSTIGLDHLELYTSDGHKYEILITCDVSEHEWQTLPVPYDTEHNPESLEIIKTYNEFIDKRKESQNSI